MGEHRGNLSEEALDGLIDVLAAMFVRECLTGSAEGDEHEHDDEDTNR